VDLGLVASCWGFHLEDRLEDRLGLYLEVLDWVVLGWEGLCLEDLDLAVPNSWVGLVRLSLQPLFARRLPF